MNLDGPSLDWSNDGLVESLPWPGDDVNKGEPKYKSLGSVFEHRKPLVEADVLIFPMMLYDLVLGLPWRQTRKLTAAKVN
jgi:hypothetical protein